MRLLRETSGPQSADSVQRDLVTIQRNMDTLQAQLIANIKNVTALQAKLAATNIAIAASGQVTGTVSSQPPVALPSSGQGLQQVSHDYTLAGMGTPSSPLGVVQQYLGTSPVLYATVQLQNNQIAGLATTPKQLVAGVAGKIIVPLTAVFLAQKPAGAGWTNGATGWSIEWAADAGTSLIGGAFGLNLNGGASKVWVVKSGNQTLIGAANDTGTALQIRTAVDITAGTGSTPTNVWVSVAYYLTPALF